MSATVYTRNTSTKLFDFIGAIHDLESRKACTPLDLYTTLFVSHWGHLSIIFLWLAGSLFHIGWTGNYNLWQANPISIQPISHSIWDPHIASTLGGTVPSYSGIYNWLYAVGIRHNTQIYLTTLALETLSLMFLLVGKVHVTLLNDLTPDEASIYASIPFSTASATTKSQQEVPNISRYTIWSTRSWIAFMDSTGLRLNYQLSALLGLSSILWAIHILLVSIPASRGISSLDKSNALMSNLSTGHWSLLSANVDSSSHIFGNSFASGTSLLTFMGGINSSTGSLHLTDIAHHHLALGVLALWAGSMYKTLYSGIGHRLQDILGSTGYRLGTFTLIRSLHLQLSLALSGISVITASVSQVSYMLPSYPYIAYDYVTTLALYVHHNWISSFLMVGAFAHATIYMIRDYTPISSASLDILYRIILHKASIISHLSWISLFLGFHTLGLYVHNDVVVSLGSPYKQILIEPIISQAVSSSVDLLVNHHAVYNAGYGLSNTSLGAGDFLASHALSLGLHTSSLILIKGSLESKSSRLVPDKSQLGFSFPCDGPSRGGTCDVSSWDAVYLALFWVLNTNAWLIFYYHWKHLVIWQASILKFQESSPYLNGWFRDYLWFNSAALIRGYDASGSSDISVWSWVFLAAHLCWAVSFMFLISWRGYWQELIDTLLYIHLKTPFLYTLWSGTFITPSALSILQARFIGLSHFAVGFIATYAAFVLGASN